MRNPSPAPPSPPPVSQNQPAASFTRTFPETVIESMPDLLTRAAECLREIGPELSRHTEQVEYLQERLSCGRFHLAVLGQVKRGKSTLLNALLGEDILPSSVIPLTAIPTFIGYGKRRSVRVHYEDGRPDEVYPPDDAREMHKIILGYVSEECNPENRLGIGFVELELPAPLLQEVVLVDTPGIGSTHRHNTETALNLLPQCDAALFLVSADPPITEVEVAFLKEVQSRVTRLFFLLNKVDYLTGAELKTALAFLRKVLTNAGSLSDNGYIFPVSARLGLLAKEQNDPTLWSQSGMGAVDTHLITFLAREKNRVLREAVGIKVRDILDDAALQLRLRIRSLEIPLDLLQERLDLFSRKIGEAEQQREHAQDILTGERKRMVELLEKESEDLRERSRKHLEGIVDEALARGPDGDARAVQDAIADEIPVYFEGALGEFRIQFDREMTAVLEGHEKKAGDLIESVRIAASELFEIPYHAPESGRAFVLEREPSWIDRKVWSSPNPLPMEVIERAMPGRIREKRIRMRVKKEIEALVVENVETLRWATLQNIQATFRRFSRELDEDLGKTIADTHGAIQETFSQRKEKAEETATLLSHLHRSYEALRLVTRQFGPEDTGPREGTFRDREG